MTKMVKGAFYFSHDSNARNDEKLIAVRMKYGIEGYGIYFMILERLLESSNYTSSKEYDVIAFDLRCDVKKIRSIIEDFGLFVVDEKGFYSESLNRRMTPLCNLREQRRLAGKLSAAKRANKKSEDKQPLKKSSTTVQRPLIENSTKVKKKNISNDENIRKSSTTVQRTLAENSTKESKVKEKNISTDVDIRKASTSTYENNLSSEILELKNSAIWIEQMQMKFKITEKEKLLKRIDDFELDCQCRGTIHRDLSDAKKHFCDWLRIKLERDGNNKTNTRKETGNSKAATTFKIIDVSG